MGTRRRHPRIPNLRKMRIRRNSVAWFSRLFILDMISDRRLGENMSAM
jgi:hypothetical protein